MPRRADIRNHDLKISQNLNPLFMVTQLFLPIYTYPPYHLLISGKLTLLQKILEVFSDSPLLFRGEKYAM